MSDTAAMPSPIQESYALAFHTMGQPELDGWSVPLWSARRAALVGHIAAERPGDEFAGEVVEQDLDILQRSLDVPGEAPWRDRAVEQNAFRGLLVSAALSGEIESPPVAQAAYDAAARLGFIALEKDSALDLEVIRDNVRETYPHAGDKVMQHVDRALVTIAGYQSTSDRSAVHSDKVQSVEVIDESLRGAYVESFVSILETAGDTKDEKALLAARRAAFARYIAAERPDDIFALRVVDAFKRPYLDESVLFRDLLVSAALAGVITEETEDEVRKAALRLEFTSSDIRNMLKPENIVDDLGQRGALHDRDRLRQAQAILLPGGYIRPRRAS